MNIQFAQTPVIQQTSMDLKDEVMGTYNLRAIIIRLLLIVG